MQKEKMPWDIRSDTRKRLVKEYLHFFKGTSTIWRDAEREKWDLHLERYVSEIANIQAQMMHPDASGIGWNGMIVFLKAPDFKEIKHFFDSQRKQAETGNIDVGVPTGHCAYWKEWVEWLERSKPKKKAVIAEPEKPKTPIDREIDRQLQSKVA